MVGKKFCFIFVLFAIAMLLICCGKEEEKQVVKKTAPAPQQSKAVQIDLWMHSGVASEASIVKQSIEKFHELQDDIRLKITELPEAVYNKQVEMAAFKAGFAGDLPCLLDFDGPNTYNYVWKGFLISLDKYISDEMRKDFLPSIITQGTFQDGKLYSLAQMESGMAIWANKAYLEKAGVRLPTVAKPWSRKEFEQVLSKLQALPEVEYALDMKMNYGVSEWFTYGFSPILQSFGADLINRSDYQSADGVLNGEAAVAAMEMIKDWFTKGYANADTQSDTDFVDGKTALSWVGYWVAKIYIEKLGDNLLLIPMPDFGMGPKTGIGTWNWGITSECKDPDAAWQVLEYLLEPEQVLNMSNFNGALPSRLSALDQSEMYAPGKLLHLYIEQIQAGFAVPRPITPAYPVISEAFAQAFNNIIRGADVQPELDKAVHKIDEDIKQHGGYKLK
jgi:multiple sugar transport system substrate-binding protein